MIFNFGGNTGITPEQIARQRQLSQSLVQAASRQPRNVGEGLNNASSQIVGALLARQANRSEAEGQKAATDLFSGAFGTPVPQTGPAPVPTDEGADRVRSGLIQRGLPEHVADAFILNFQDESGLNPGINEQNPLVEGSRGGFGLAQWTGPRRRALEAFAQQRGVPVSDVDLQLDFLVSELSGSEKAAAQEILAAGDTGTAAAAIVNKFLRPAEEHRARRASRYLGGSQPQSGPNETDLISVLTHPFSSPEQKAAAQQMLGQRRQAEQLRQQQQFQIQQAEAQRQARLNDPMFQAQLEGAQLANQQAGVDLANSQNPEPGFTQVTGADLGLQGEASGQLFNVDPNGKITSIGGGGTNVTINSGSEVGTIPPGYEMFTDPNTGARSLRPIEGGPVAREIQEQQEQAVKAQEVASKTDSNRANVVTRTIGNIREKLEGGGPLDLPETGVVGERLARFGLNQEAVDVGADLETLKGMVTFDRLEQLRNASANGSSGLGQVTNVEIGLLSSQLGTLDQRASPGRIMDVLGQIEDVFGRLSPDAQSYLLGETNTLPGPDQGSQPEVPDFTQMDLGAVLEFDMSNASAETLAAWNKRMDELEGGNGS